MARSFRRRSEAVLAILFAGAVVAAGAGVLVFFLTISPVHTDPGAVPSTSTPAGAPDDRDAAAAGEGRRLARSLVVEQNLPGLSVAVARDGRLAWAEGFGWADVEARQPVTPATRFRIGGVSRALTAAAAALLSDRGRLDLDAPVQRYVPAFPRKRWAVTTRQLMGEVAGIRSPRFERESLPRGHCATLDEALAVFREDPLLFEPGTARRDSPYGWVLVSAVVEAAAGEPFYEFMHREVFQAIGMERTGLDEAGAPGVAWFYFPRAFERPDLGLQEDPPAVDYSCWAGAGAFLSTPSDLARFGAATLAPGFLRAETVALLQAPRRLEPGEPAEYALGWRVETVPLAGTPTRMVGQRGGAVGGTALLMTFPELRLVVAASTNVSYAGGLTPFALSVAQAFSTPAREGSR